MTSRISAMALPSNEPSRRDRSREALLAWFRVNDPAYPWRGLHDPFAVLVSEIMLQQTQASRVAEAFPGFMQRFPDARALATASRADVLRAWGGLGYSRRAASLQDAARSIVRELGGEVPPDVTT